MFAIKKNATILSLTVGLLGATVCAHADILNFSPTPNDMYGLDHFKYYSWGINYTLPSTQKITSATLTIHHIYDWIKEDNDHLYLTLLNNAALGVKVFDDNETPGNAWAGQGLQFADWSDPQGGSDRNFDLVINLDGAALTKLNTQAAMGKMGIGFDPDCHYFNCGIDFTICTAAVPEPATMATIGLGVIGLIRKRRNRK